MVKKEVVAMLLAGGQGSRLGVLTKNMAKPAVPFGGEYRLIDFPLSNCSNSGIDTVGVLTQYKPLVLNSYLGVGKSWDLDRNNGGITVLPPHTRENERQWYMGTANAVYQNIEYIDLYNPQYVLILSGDHIYKMDYSLMLKFHKEKEAQATIAVIKVPWKETYRFGIMNCNKNNKINEFEEKPKNAKSNLASMGIYIFNWKILKKYFLKKSGPNIDFGKDIIPRFIDENRSIYTYRFNDYWKDVGTIESYWEAHMDLLTEKPALNLYDKDWRIYSVNPNKPPQFIAETANINHSLINKGTSIYGNINNSVLSYGIYVGENSSVKNSVIMPNVTIKSNVIIENSIICSNTIVNEGASTGKIFSKNQKDKITVLGEKCNIDKNTVIKRGEIVVSDKVISQSLKKEVQNG